MIVEILVVVILLTRYCHCMLKQIKKCKEIVEKVIDIILLIISVVFLIVYYADRFNLPSLLGMNKNVDTQNWLTIITTSTASIISSAIGGLIAFGIARNEIGENRRQNDENLRIQNMPMLKYKIKIKKIEYEAIDEEYLMATNCDVTKSSMYKLAIYIENVGLNNVKRIIVDIESSILNEEHRICGDSNLIFIPKDHKIEVNRYLMIENRKKYKLNLKVYYQDVLRNWYFQTIEIIIDINKADNILAENEKVICKVNEEILLNEFNDIDKNIV